MTEFLDEDWLGELEKRGAELPVSAGATLVCQAEVSGAPAGKVRFYTVWSEGRVVEAALGKHGSPDCVFSTTASDALEILRGDTEPEVAFMQGRLKIEGDYKLFLVDLAQWRTGEALRQLGADLASLASS